jgi:hypothetical protein
MLITSFVNRITHILLSEVGLPRWGEPAQRDPIIAHFTGVCQGGTGQFRGNSP